MVSIVIPVYNEERLISSCLDSLSRQTFKDFEVILVDDESTDSSKASAKSLKLKNLQILSQNHQGPGPARNLGVKHAKGGILVFVDADMTFETNFIKKLTEPILKGKTKGTFTKEEFVANWDNLWARCWNYNEGIGNNRRISQDYPDSSPVFRAILKTEFDKVGGFDNIGFTDDWTLSRKLGFRATVAPDAICYHRNPETLKEIYRQARWIGKNEFISGNPLKRLISLIRFNLVFQTIRGVFISAKYKELAFLVFQFIYYLGINMSICFSFLGEETSK